MTHRVTIRLTYSEQGVPYKWKGICTCGWRCISWHWRLRGTPIDRGAMPMALKHLCEAQGGPHAGFPGS